MGLFDKFKNKKASSSGSNRAPSGDVNEAYIKELQEYAVQFIPGTFDEVQTHRKMLKMIEPIIPIDKCMLGMDAQFVLERNSFGDISKFQLLGMIGYDVNRWLDSFKKGKIIEKIKKADTDTLIRCWIVLSCYSEFLKPEYKANIVSYYYIIANEIYHRGFTIPKQINSDDTPPVILRDNDIHIDSRAFAAWTDRNPNQRFYELRGALKLAEKEPVISLYDDGIKTREYKLQTEGDESFAGKFFLISVRLHVFGAPPIPAAQIDGFISDSSEERSMELSDIGYRMEGYLLTAGGDNAKKRYEQLRGQDLVKKGLKYPGYTTPANVRLIGVCQDCKKSFAFHGYSFYMAQSDVAYSDDGLDCCEIKSMDIDKDTWSFEADGKTFCYYNSFCCPHCGSAYIDYKKHPENKVFGVSGCVHLGRKAYSDT